MASTVNGPGVSAPESPTVKATPAMAAKLEGGIHARSVGYRAVSRQTAPRWSTTSTSPSGSRPNETMLPPPVVSTTGSVRSPAGSALAASRSTKTSPLQKSPKR